MTALEEPQPALPAAQDPNADLGFGSVVARESRQRLLNRDGTFNVSRGGLRFWESHSAYHYFLTMTWSRFLGHVLAVYVLTNAVFAAAFVACGSRALTGFDTLGLAGRYGRAFFFSVQTLATIGYGGVAPENFAANMVVTVEALVGLIGFALVAGIVFARFSRPVAQIIFSRTAVIAPYRGKTAFMFRIVNQKYSELVELHAKVLLSRRRRDGGGTAGREFIALDLEREQVVFFPLTWTVVHPIDERSPLYGLSAPDLREAEAEFLVLLNGFDETFSQTVHTRSSYLADEVVWGARFANIFNPPSPDGSISVDIRRLHEIELADLG
jgi:inward rectifier potassium channel